MLIILSHQNLNKRNIEFSKNFFTVKEHYISNVHKLKDNRLIKKLIQSQTTLGTSKAITNRIKYNIKENSHKKLDKRPKPPHNLRKSRKNN